MCILIVEYSTVYLFIRCSMTYSRSLLCTCHCCVPSMYCTCCTELYTFLNGAEAPDSLSGLNNNDDTTAAAELLEISIAPSASIRSDQIRAEPSRFYNRIGSDSDNLCVHFCILHTPVRHITVPVSSSCSRREAFPSPSSQSSRASLASRSIASHKAYCTQLY